MIRYPALVTALAGVALLFGTATASASPTSPATNPAHTDTINYFNGDNCHPERQALCLFRDYGYTGGGVYLQSGDKIPALRSFNFAEQMSSWANDSGVTCYWYTENDFKGTEHPMFNGYRIQLPSHENDTANSVRCDG